MCLLHEPVVMSPSIGRPRYFRPSSQGQAERPRAVSRILSYTLILWVFQEAESLACIYVAGHVIEKSQINRVCCFFLKGFGIASPFDTLSHWPSYALRKTISLGHKDPRCKQVNLQPWKRGRTGQVSACEQLPACSQVTRYP